MREEEKDLAQSWGETSHKFLSQKQSVDELKMNCPGIVLQTSISLGYIAKYNVFSRGIKRSI